MTHDNSELSRALCMEASRPQPLPQKIKDYIANGADINYQLENDGFTPLMLAVGRVDEPLVTYLLQQGANPLIKNKYGEIASDLLIFHSPIYQLLINHELLMATSLNDLKNAKRALKAGAEVNFQGREGYTALLIAAELGSLELVELLLVYGADSTIRRNDGRGYYQLTNGDLLYRTIHFGKPFTKEQKSCLLQAEEGGEDYDRWERWRLKSLADRNGQPFSLSHLKMYDFDPAPTESKIKELEQHFKHPLPNSLIEIFNNYNGASLELDHFGDEGRWTIGHFYPLFDNRDCSWDIWSAIDSFSENIGPETLPFAVDYHGDVYYLKWVDGKAQVWIFAYSDRGYDYDEDDYEEGQVPSEKTCLFDSLDDLLEELYAARD